MTAQPKRRSSSPPPPGSLDAQVHAYRQKRRRLLAQERIEKDTTACESLEEELIRYALAWVPYGGAPEEETFQRYRLAAPQFTDRLWRAVRTFGCSANTVPRSSARCTS